MNNFYTAFESQYRGSRELIKKRQLVYLPFLEFLKKDKAEIHAIDLGCGRGEWLELLKENEINATGVDLDEDMLEICKNMGFQALKLDALEAIKKYDDQSLDLITGFHIAEHLPFPILLEITQEAYRVLKPGGLFILETPNPENIQVATVSFYIDPTHKNPIPIQLLSFVYKYSGFDEIKNFRINADYQLDKLGLISLRDVLTGNSRDYSVIGLKGFDDDSHRSISEVGQGAILEVTFDNLLGRFDSQPHELNERLRDTNQHLTTQTTQVQEIQAQIQEIYRLMQIQNEQISSLNLKITDKALLTAIQKVKFLLINIYRQVNYKLKMIKGLIRSNLVFVLKIIGLYSFLHKIYRRRLEKNNMQLHYDSLNPYVKNIYQDLVSSIKNKKDL